MQQSNAKSLPTSTVWSSLKRFTKSKNNSSAAVKTMMVSVLILLVNMLTGVLTARYLGPSGRGEQTAMVSWSQFLAFSMSFGIPSALIYNAKKNPDEAGVLYRVALLIGLGFGIIAMTVGIIVLPYWLDSFSSEVVLFAQVSMILCPLIVVSQINNAAFQFRGDYKTFNWQRYLVPLLTLAVIGILILTGSMNPYTTALAYLGPSVPLFIWMTLLLLRTYKVKMRNTYRNFKRLFTYGLGSYGNDLLGQFSTYIDQIIIAGLLRPADLGLYAVAVSLSRMVNFFSNSITVVLFPKASELSKDEAISLTFKAFRISTTCTLLGALFLMLVAPFVIPLLYGKDFNTALTVFRLLLLEVTISGGTLILAQTFMALGKPKFVSILQGVGLLLVIPLLFLLVPKFGLFGAGVAMLSSAILRFLFIILNIRYNLKVKLPRLLISREDIQWMKTTMNSYIRKKPADPAVK
ncbi:oligosaccharide flippase family protein [Paenibacillus typhae]|uniref:Membrane protein involved in the export of O-antigen and teichoic acid n=1 Tax=Paenibacillus typhae TaxID=1174501 RepID=A0A1G9A896_9BACL|nr:oligosaccharide flippase family protein [Paenibacillus typhae]SDK23044.1 Membrane protein involved in the export of O-antigen and teichoic acid [Paenibacillus typhae]